MGWDWHGRGAEVERARKLCVPSHAPDHAARAAAFHAAVERAWPPGFFADLERCRRGDPSCLEMVLDFLEASPRFFRSGYIHDRALRFVARPPRSQAQAERMRALVLDAVDGKRRKSLRRFGSLARAVQSERLHAELIARLDQPNAVLRARAAEVLAALGPSTPEQRALAREEQRLLCMLVTASQQRHLVVLRRLLAIDPATLSPLGRRRLAVGFELALNWNALSEDELVAIASRLDGPEMDDIWAFAFARADETGIRARRIFARLEER